MHKYGFNFSLQNRVGFRISINFPGFLKIFQIKMVWPSAPLLKLQTGKDFYKCQNILSKLSFKDLEISAAKVVRI